MAISDLFYVDGSGIHCPDYPTILSLLQAEYRAIYGADVYLEADSQDGQWIAVQALAIYDTMQTAVAVYNSFSPLSALSDALSRNVKINGIRRRVATYSTADLVITGEAGTIITNGLAEDTLGQKWALPASVTIPPSCTITVTATAVDIGAVTAAANSITKISTPTFGWLTVNNPAVAIIGTPVETDYELRQRQAISTTIPSLTILDGIMGAVASLSGVTRCKGYENDSTAADSDGIPANSISLVVEGGTNQDIANAIGRKKTPGAGTYGTISAIYTDARGLENQINFFRPTQATIGVEVTVKAFTGYTSGFGELIKAELVKTITAMGIGDDVLITKLYVPANLPGNAAGSTFNLTGLRIKKNAGAFDTVDIPLAFNEVAICAASNITVIVT